MSNSNDYSEKVITDSRIIRILSSVPYENGFHFFTAIGQYTGETATSLEIFAAKLEKIDADSVKFHFQRGDFQEWIENTIGDIDLAERISKSGRLRQLPVEDLRKELIGMVQTRLAELRQLHRRRMEHSH